MKTPKRHMEAHKRHGDTWETWRHLRDTWRHIRDMETPKRHMETPETHASIFFHMSAHYRAILSTWSLAVLLSQLQKPGRPPFPSFKNLAVLLSLLQKPECLPFPSFRNLDVLLSPASEPWPPTSSASKEANHFYSWMTGAPSSRFKPSTFTMTDWSTYHLAHFGVRQKHLTSPKTKLN